VIPVLVDGAPMPQASDLPESLKKLPRRQAIEISHNRFNSDAERLTEALAELEEELRRREKPAGHARAASVSGEASPTPAASQSAQPGCGRARQRPSSQA